LRYPFDALLPLARSIVARVESHHRNLLEAAEAAGDDDEEAEQVDYLTDVDILLCAIDRPRWKARVEKDRPDFEWSDDELEFINEQGYEESGLFTIGDKKCSWVGYFLISPYIFGPYSVRSNRSSMKESQ
jgi:hypothetical protein